MKTTKSAVVRVGMKVRMIEAGRRFGKFAVIIGLSKTHADVQLDDEAWKGSYTAYPLRKALNSFEVVS